MNEPLKRTFHGCLTCRKRKVRCQGGNPCQNCVRMNINCHSSFSTNLRVVVPTPGGQMALSPGKDTESEPALGRPPTAIRPSGSGNQVPAPSAAVVPSNNAGSGAEDQLFAPDFRKQAPTFSSQSPLPTYTRSSTTANLLASEDGNLSSPALDQSWGFGFSLDPFVGGNFNPMIPSEASPVVNQMPSHHTYPTTASMSLSNLNCDSDSDGSVMSSGDRTQTGAKEWIPRYRKKSKKRNDKPSKEPAQPGRADSDQAKIYLKHYLEYAQTTLVSKDDVKWSYHRFVIDFVTTCSETCPFRLAVLAWAAKHCNPASSTQNNLMETWYGRAHEAVLMLMTLADATVEFSKRKQVKNAAEIILTSTLYLTRFDILNQDMRSVDARFCMLTEWLARHPYDLVLSAFSCKVLLWLCYMQIRIGLFSLKTSPASMLLDELIKRLDYHIILEQSHTYNSNIFADEYPAEELAQDIEMIPITLRLHETFCLMSAMLRYRSWRRTWAGRNLESFVELTLSKQTAIDGDVHHIDVEFGLAILTNPTAGILRHSEQNAAGSTTANAVSRTALSWMIAYAAFLAAKILWSRMLHREVRTDDSARAAVASILQIAMRLRKLKGQPQQARVLSSTLWPLPLIVAGIETTDDIHADWIKLLITQIRLEASGQVAERSGRDKGAVARGNESPRHLPRGLNNRTTSDQGLLELMDQVRDRQDVLGSRIDIEAVAREMSGELAPLIFLSSMG